MPVQLRRLAGPLAVAVAAGGLIGGLAGKLPTAWADTNLLAGAAVTGSAPCTDGEGATAAVDGGPRGFCSAAGPAWLRIDLGTTRPIGRVVVRHAGRTGAGLRDFTLSISADGTTFATVVTVIGNTAAETVHHLPPIPARHLRLDVPGPGPGGERIARITEIEAYPAAAPARSPAPGGCGSPVTLTGAPGRGLTRTWCDADAAVYLDDALRARPAAATAWIAPFTADVWRYIRQAYGSCVVPRPACAEFGGPVVAAYRQSPGPGGGGTIRYRFDPAAGYRPAIEVTGDSWSAQNPVLRDVIVHEACHHAEFDGQGMLDSPAFGVWGDSKWAEFCLFDFYTATGRDADAARVRRQFLASRDGAHGAAWFRDWFLPLWQDGGRGPDVQRRFFELLARHFPSRDAGSHGRYLRRMTTGEYVHFTSAAAGRDLSGRAALAFGAGFDRTQFAQARRDFPDLTY